MKNIAQRIKIIVLGMVATGVLSGLFVLAGPSAPSYAAGEQYAWKNDGLITAKGGVFGSSYDLTIDDASGYGTPKLHEDSETYCQARISVSISSDNKTISITYAGVNVVASQPGATPVQSCSSTESSAIKALSGTSSTITGSRSGGDETAEQREIGVFVSNPNKKSDSPKSVVVTLKNSSGKEIKKFTSNIGGNGNYYGEFTNVNPGTYTACVDKVATDKCKTVTKERAKRATVDFGESSVFQVITVNVEVNVTPDDTGADQSYGPYDIELKKGDKVIKTEAANMTYPACSGEACGGVITVKDKLEFKNVEPGDYKICAGSRCVDAQKKEDRPLEVTLAMSQDDIDNIEAGSGDETTTTSCAIDGIGWIICPIMSFVGTLNDAAHGFLTSILEIQPALINSQSTQNAWAAFRDIANVAFVIAFMVIVYSQLTSAGITNYGVKKMLPRIVIAAILVNISFLICAIAVDVSNIVGSSIYSLLKDSIDVGNEIEADAWGNSIDGILQGAATAVGIVLLVVALAMAPMALLAFLVIILIIVARQALVILLVVVAPLAFVAYLLPNTEDWFKKWWKALTVTLMVYPIVGAVFGASTLASRVLTEVAQGGDENQELLLLIALGVLAVPLFAVPAILKGSLSAAGSIGTKIAGLADRSTRASSNQFSNRAKAESKALGDAMTSRALKRQGVLGGVAGAGIRGRARRLKRYEQHDRSRKAAEKQFGVTDPNASRREGRAQHDEETANKEEEDFKNRIKLEHLDLNVDLHGRAIESGLNLHNREEEHKNEVGANHMRANPNQYDALNASRGEKQSAELESKLRFEGSAVGGTQSQTIQALEDQMAETKADQRTNYKQSAAGQVNQIARKGAEGAEKITDQANELTFQSSAVGGAQSSQMKAVEGELNIVRGEQEVAFEGSNVGQAQAVAKDNVAQRKAVVTSRSEAAAVEANADVRIQAQAAKDTLEVAKADETAFIQELRTDAGAAEYLVSQQSPEVQATVQELQTADTQKRVQSQRTANAQKVANVEYAQSVGKDPANPSQIAVEAAGIAGAAGVSQAQAVAFQTMVKAHNEGVAAEKTLFSQTENEALLSRFDDPDFLDQPDEQISAIAGTIAGREHQESHVKLWSKMGRLTQQAQAELASAPDQASQDRAREKIEKLKNMQQQVMGDKRKTPFGVGARAQGEATVGEYAGDIFESTRDRITTDLSGETLSTMDPDDMRLVFEMAREGKLSDDELLKVATAYDDWESDPLRKSSLKDKHRKLLDPIRQHATTGAASYQQDGSKYAEIASMTPR